MQKEAKGKEKRMEMMKRKNEAMTRTARGRVGGEWWHAGSGAARSRATR
jgi:hypothetical protein